MNRSKPGVSRPTPSTKPIPVPKNRRPRRNATKAVTHDQLNGRKFTPPTNPPDVTSQPWYPLTLAWVDKPGNVTFSTVIAIFRKQLDPQKSGLNQNPFNSNTGTPLRVQFRFRKVSVWNLSGKALSLSVYDDLEQNNTDKDQLGGWTDCGGPSYFPAIGYIYPYSHANRVHRPDPNLKDTVIYNTTASGTSDSILSHLHLLWRFDGSVRALSVLPSEEEALLSSIKDLTAEIKASQPSTFEKVVDGVKSAAALVTIAASTSFAERVSPSDPEVDSLVELVVQRLALRGVTRAPNTPSDDGLSEFSNP